MAGAIINADLETVAIRLGTIADARLFHEARKPAITMPDGGELL
jgi:hypothetical protein